MSATLQSLDEDAKLRRLLDRPRPWLAVEDSARRPYRGFLFTANDSADEEGGRNWFFSLIPTPLVALVVDSLHHRKGYR